MADAAPERAARTPLVTHPDGVVRCFWCGSDPLYMAYHDTEWGVPERDGRALFEKLLLDGFQAGLSWITILRKRENFRRAFDGFEPEKMARYDAAKIEALMQDAGIVRNRAKVEGAVLSARAYLAMRDEGIDFAKFLWDSVGGRTQVNRPKRISDIAAETPQSRALSKRLKARGFKFVGPTIVYAAMQACGLVDDHLAGCHCART
ncbi:DNA-3-methyladenine glycosylase I [Xanthobacter sp. KR7-65]|uniref:DNA-3-methyladenine glycosylase I n=1 Tax=Xanthobacter sp. KR7-65 TaxID=3156612 RepID=UPI0032B43A05